MDYNQFETFKYLGNLNNNYFLSTFLPRKACNLSQNLHRRSVKIPRLREKSGVCFKRRRCQVLHNIYCIGRGRGKVGAGKHAISVDTFPHAAVSKSECHIGVIDPFNLFTFFIYHLATQNTLLKSHKAIWRYLFLHKIANYEIFWNKSEILLAA
jgi:hypothetical protein